MELKEIEEQIRYCIDNGMASPVSDIIKNIQAYGVEQYNQAIADAAKEVAGTSPINQAPLKSFADLIEEIENPKDSFTCFGNTFKEGDSVYGSWVNQDGSTYYQSGKIIRNEKTGLWVQSQPNGGITEIKRFHYLNHS